MKILLDTQAFIWLTNGDTRIGSKARLMLEDVSNQISISYFSCFEMSIKASIGKLEYDQTIVDDLPDMGIELVMPTMSSLSRYNIHSPNNKDPFDNMLIAIALEENATLLTSDAKMLGTVIPRFKVIDVNN